MAKVAGFPIPIVSDSSFSTTQAQDLQYAVQQWNAVGQQLIQGDFFSLQPAGNFQTTAPDIGSCGSNLPGGDSTLYLMNVSSQTDWTTLEKNHSVPNASSVGVTFRCTIGDQAQRQVTAIDTAQIDSTQLSSVILHELGHGLGLDHSCSSGTGTSSFASCSGLADNHPYHLAVMFPTLQMPTQGGSYVEVKDHVQSNDIDRTQCLYGN